MVKDAALKYCIKGIIFERQRVPGSFDDPTFRNASDLTLFDQRFYWLDTTDFPSPTQQKTNTSACTSSNVQKCFQIEPVAQQVYEFQCGIVLISLG
jgi:hypothetical protein